METKTFTKAELIEELAYARDLLRQNLKKWEYARKNYWMFNRGEMLCFQEWYRESFRTVRMLKREIKDAK